MTDQTPCSLEECSAPRGPRAVIAIPARLKSTRLPDKLLLSETGRPLLAHVIDRAVEAKRLAPGLFSDIVIACDDRQLFAVAEKAAAADPTAGIRPVMTGVHHKCGTTRIAEAIEALTFKGPVEMVVNVQGDEPELNPEAIVCVAEELERDQTCAMATLVVPMPAGTEEMKANPNAVKALLDGNGRAIYFSRAPIPFDRNPPAKGEPLWHHHLGIYAYRKQFLLQFASLPTSPLEDREGLEQLRAIDAGKRIRVGKIPHTWAGKGIDTPEDYRAFVERIRHKQVA